MKIRVERAVSFAILWWLEPVSTDRYLCSRQSVGHLIQREPVASNIEVRLTGKLRRCERPKPVFVSVEPLLRFRLCEPQLLMHVFIEVFEELRPGFLERGCDLFVEVFLQLVKGLLNLIGSPASLLDVVDSFSEIDSGFERPKDFIRRPENSIKQPELLVENLENPLVSIISSVDEVDDDDVMLLAVPVAATDPLLNALPLAVRE